MLSDKVRVRFAPSPTGFLHVGGARTALFNWLFARQQGGVFVLRMEDTDQKRNTPEARATIFSGLAWLGLEPDEGPEQGGPHGPYSQSERGDLYQRAVQELKLQGGLYPCFCSKARLAELRARQQGSKTSFAYDRRCRDIPGGEAQARLAAGESATWRLKVPAGETVLQDLVRGPITVQHADVEDIILIRADGTPVYNLAVVIDDHHMQITHVLRGEDHLTNTFKQVILFRALGWEPPRFGHLPLILGPTGEGKLSKRKHQEAALEHYREADYPADAMVNWLARIGWSFDDTAEIMSRSELIERFSLESVSSSGARLPLEKLESLGGHYLRQMPRSEVAAHLSEHLQRAGLLATTDQDSEATLEALVTLFQGRLNHFSAIVEAARWVFEAPTSYAPKAARNLQKGDQTAELLRAFAGTLADPLARSAELEQQARSFAEQRCCTFGQLVHPVRAALTGSAGGPPLFDCLILLGAQEACRRLEVAAAWVTSQQQTPHP